jgi:hypothetical protein
MISGMMKTSNTKMMGMMKRKSEMMMPRKNMMPK